MKITTITYTRGATVNRGNYNSERIEASVTVQVDGDESPEDAYQRAREWVTKRVKADMMNKEDVA